MSRWTLPLIGLLGLALMALPLSAQENPWRTATESAPMPRSKNGSLELRFDLFSTAPVQLTANAPAKVTPPHYIIKAPDILLLEVVMRTKTGTQRLPEQAIGGQYLVRPDGTVGLGMWGSVNVSGLMLDQTADAIRQHLMKSTPLVDLGTQAESLAMIVDVLAFNSKRYYVIRDGNVCAMPMTGSESVLDALAQVDGLSKASKPKIWVARPRPNSDQHQILPVDWVELSQHGITTTNYQILSGDRLFVKTQNNLTPEASARVAVSAPARLSGTWYRESPGMISAFTFKNGELTITMKMCGEGGAISIATITAEYAVLQDGTVHGVFTGADVDVKGNTDILGLELAQMSMEMQAMVDQPFALRCRTTEGGLMISNLRFPDPKGEMKESNAMMCGKYVFAEKGMIPSPKATTAIRNAGRRDAVCPIDNPTFQVATPPLVLQPPPTVCPVPVPYGPPAEVHQMMFQTFGQMLGNPVPPQVCLPPIASATPTSYFVPPPPMPSPRGTALPVGTWARDVGPMRYKLEVKENHLTATITTTDEDDGKSMSVDHILTADFYPTRNPGEVVGLITGFDMTATGPGVSRSDARELTKMLPAIQKALADKPIAFTFRIYDDVLVLGNVRFPSIIGELDEMTKAFEGIAGRYKGSNAAPVTVLSVAASEPARIGVDFNFHPPRFYGAPPVPPMPPPVPLPATQANPFRNGGN